MYTYICIYASIYNTTLKPPPNINMHSKSNATRGQQQQQQQQQQQRQQQQQQQQQQVGDLFVLGLARPEQLFFLQAEGLGLPRAATYPWGSSPGSPPPALGCMYTPHERIFIVYRKQSK